MMKNIMNYYLVLLFVTFKVVVLNYGLHDTTITQVNPFLVTNFSYKTFQGTLNT